MTAGRRLKPWMIVAVAWVIPALLGAVDSIGQHAVWGGPLRGREVLFTALDWLIYGVFTPVIFERVKERTRASHLASLEGGYIEMLARPLGVKPHEPFDIGFVAVVD